MAHPDGELATARGAAAAGAVHVVSTMASNTIEEVAEAAPDGRRWFQLYVQRDRSQSRDFVRRAEAAGYEAICLTVDLPVLGYRDEVVRRGFDPGEDAYANIPKRGVWRGNGDMDEDLDTRNTGLAWDDLAEIRSWSSLPLVLKGILTAEDAALAVEHGVDGIWVSTHGGRQLDRTFAAVEVLAEVVEAVAGRAEVYLDGGVRRGPDVLIALALGATAVFTARPFLYALACGGEAGVARAFAVLREDLERSMALLGVARLGRRASGARRGRTLGAMTESLPVDPALVDEAASLEPDAAEARHAELSEQVRRANRLYYEDDAPELEDAEYDQLFRRLVALETAFPALITPESPPSRSAARRRADGSPRSTTAGRCSRCPTPSATTSCARSTPGSVAASGWRPPRSPRRAWRTSRSSRSTASRSRSSTSAVGSRSGRPAATGARARTSRPTCGRSAGSRSASRSPPRSRPGARCSCPRRSSRGSTPSARSSACRSTRTRATAAPARCARRIPR